MNWIPISELPEAWKDGRQVLLGEVCAKCVKWAAVCTWSTDCRWRVDHWTILHEYGWEPTHFSPDFVPPNDTYSVPSPSLSDEHREALRSAARLMLQIAECGLENRRMTLEEIEYVTRPLEPTVT